MPLSVPVIVLGSVIQDRLGGGTGVITGTGGHSHPPLSGLWHVWGSRHLMRLTANSASPLRPTGLHKGPMHIQVQEGNSTRTSLSRDFVLVDRVAIQIMSVLLEKLSVLVIISCVLFQMVGVLVAYVSSSGRL